MDRTDQGFVALAKSVGTRILGIAAGIFNGRQNRVDEETDFLLGKLAQSNSIVCPHLTEPILQELLEIKTSKGFTLKDGLRRGIRNKDKTGITAGDEESYVLFQRVFDPLVKEIHEISAHHLPISSLKPDALGKTVFDRQCVFSCRIRVLRSLKGFPFSWFCTIEERISIQTIVTGVLEKLKGAYIAVYSLSSREEGVFSSWCRKSKPRRVDDGSENGVTGLCYVKIRILLTGCALNCIISWGEFTK